MKRKAHLFIIAILLAAVAIGCVLSNKTFPADNTDNTDTKKEISFQKEASLLKSILQDDIFQVDQLLSDMTLEEKVGQMFIGCFYTGTPSPETVAQYHLGGVVLFGASFKSTPPEEVTANLDAIDSAADIAPLIAVDEEGGTVVRVSASRLYRSEPFQSPRELFAAGGLDAIVTDTHEKNQLLLELGIDMNLAPVCDISQNPDDYIYERSLGENAKTTAAYTKQVVSACVEDGMGCCLKHFPGYGSTSDTHNGAATDTHTLKQIKKTDLIPFQAGIDAGAHSVLMSHNIVTALDQELPASLSPAVHKILRDDMGFNGVIMTDDLSMGAITQFSPDTDSAVSAVIAGNDMLCTGDYADQYQAVLDAVRSGMISEARIDISVRRILQLKLDLGLIGGENQTT